MVRPNGSPAPATARHRGFQLPYAKANEKGAIDIIGSFVQLNVAVLANQINNAIRGIILERRGGTGRAKGSRGAL